ncbi:TRAP transporter large permease subunit [Egibacter rhizosphaerae]|uniref:TRAP transporter large permease subunit n=1 Tax=Egibacter rhizosphaerae TaxID=1670831 RepID=A0A411YFF1_9ACTN|nr:TRAP transporter large permease subunit [Egibacter rhizosphaerae]QBI19901.1 TRAP transporter large permease subunit [Egibacter rhizosphaerae]
MEWWAFLLLFLGALVLLLLVRVPIAFAMLGVGTVASVIMFGGWDSGLQQVALSAVQSIDSFVLTPVPLFILMGEVLFRAGVAHDALQVLNRVLGRVPGRLPVLATGGGALFGLLSGSTLANTALFGSSLLPEMNRFGYSERLSMGSILASGGLAMIIPPSALAVLWGAIAQVSVGPLLIAGIVPGLLMAVGYLVVIAYWSVALRGAPRDEEVARASRRETARGLLRHVAPLALVILLVLGLIFFGIATPTESAAVGALAAFGVVVLAGRLNRTTLRAAMVGTIQTNTMIFFIVAGSVLYSQLLSFSGATRGLIGAMTDAELAPLLMLLLMMLAVLFLGAFLDQVSIMLVTIPLFMPIVEAQAWNPIWFGILMLINLQIAGTTPPFGLNLFVMKGVAPPETRMGTVYLSALPFIGSDLVVIGLLIAVPTLVTWLPGLMTT